VVGSLWMQFEVDRLATRCLPRSVGRRQFHPAEVLVDHRQFGVQVVTHHVADDLSQTERFRCCQSMSAGYQLVARRGFPHADRIDQPNRCYTGGKSANDVIVHRTGVAAQPAGQTGSPAVRDSVRSDGTQRGTHPLRARECSTGNQVADFATRYGIRYAYECCCSERPIEDCSRIVRSQQRCGRRRQRNEPHPGLPIW
jgi:hypothetical protein